MLLMLSLVADMLRAHVPKLGLVDKSCIWQAQFSQVVHVPKSVPGLVCFWGFLGALISNGRVLNLILLMRPGSKTGNQLCHFNPSTLHLDAFSTGDNGRPHAAACGWCKEVGRRGWTQRHKWTEPIICMQNRKHRTTAASLAIGKAPVRLFHDTARLA